MIINILSENVYIFEEVSERRIHYDLNDIASIKK